MSKAQVLNKELMDKYFIEENLLYVHEVGEVKIYFYDYFDSELMKYSTAFQSGTFKYSKNFYVLIHRGYFNETIRDNNNALKEISEILIESRNPGLCNLIIPFLLLLFAPINITMYMFRFSNMFVQVLSIISFIVLLFVTGFIYYKNNEENILIRSIRNGLYLNYLTDITHMKKKDEYLKGFYKKGYTYNLLRKRYKHNRYRKKTVRNRKIVGYSLGVFFILFMITPPIMLIENNFIETYDTMNHIRKIDSPYIPMINRTSYELVDIKENPTQEVLVNCGNYYCSDYYVHDDVFTTDYEKIDLDLITGYETVIIFSVINNHALVLSKNPLDDENSLYQIIDIENEIVTFTVSEDDFTDYSGALEGYVTGMLEVNGTYYIYGNIYNDDNDDNDDNDIVGYILNTTKSIETDLIIFDQMLGLNAVQYLNNHYYIYLNTYQEKDQVFKYNNDFNLVDSFYMDNEDHYSMLFLVDNEIILSQHSTGLYSYLSNLTEEFSSEPDLNYSWYESIQITSNEETFFIGAYLQTIKEYDNDFNQLSNGLRCKECTKEMEVDYYYASRDDDYLYLSSKSNILTFEQVTPSYYIYRSQVSTVWYVLSLVIICVVNLHYLRLTKIRNNIKNLFDKHNHFHQIVSK